MVSKTLLAVLALTAFLATVPLSAADCSATCNSDMNNCATKCSTDEACAVKCVKAGIGCVCKCASVSTRKMSTTTSAEEYRNTILRFTATRSDLSDLSDCIKSATSDFASCTLNCKMDMSCHAKCAEKYQDGFCKCGAASLQAGLLVALAALLSWLNRH